MRSRNLSPKRRPSKRTPQCFLGSLRNDDRDRSSGVPHTWDPGSVPPVRALERLIEGNRRFRDPNVLSPAPTWSREMAAQEQRPFAIILGCSDSRTPVEILLDQGFGDLFVVRIAGNIVAP